MTNNRLEEIRGREIEMNDNDEPDIYDAVAELRGKDGNCLLCGHLDLDADGVTCAAPVPICSDETHGLRHCGCKCLFLKSKVVEQAYSEGFNDAAKVSRVLNSIDARPAVAVDVTALCTPVPCGKQPILPAERVGCGEYITSELDLYRCADCTVPFHRECLRAHFGSTEHASETAAVAADARELVAELAKDWGLSSETEDDMTERITAYANQRGEQRYHDGLEVALVHVQQRLNYVASKDLRNGWSVSESGPCCDKCAMQPEHLTGRADALKALVGCRNPFQLPEVCECHKPTRQAVKNGVTEILSQVLRSISTLLNQPADKVDG